MNNDNDDLPKRPNRSGVTLRDIAIRAGVSTATVSRALAEPHKVSDSARARIMQVVEETSYMPNAAARNLRVRRSMMMLVVAPNLSNQFATAVLRALDSALILAGYDMIVGSLDNEPEREARFVRMAASGQVDAVMLMTGRIPRDDDRKMTDLGLPMAAVGAAIPDFDAPQVVVDDHAASMGVARHLLALGHRRLGYACGSSDSINEHDRRNGYLQGIAEANIDPDTVTLWPGTFTSQSGVEAANAFLALDRVQRPTAVFAASDVIAFGFMKTVLDAGLTIPGDVSIVGFDGLDMGLYVRPTLATVCQPCDELGRAAAQVLLDVVERRPTESKRLVIPTEFFAGESTAPAQHQAEVP